MKPINARSRKDAQDPLQLDFLAAIPQPPRPLAPVETGTDGTPPLPLSTTPEPTPPRSVFSDHTPTLSAVTDSRMEGTSMATNPGNDVADVFESDPFFSAGTLQRKQEPNDSTFFEVDEIPQEDVPSITLAPPAPPSAPTSDSFPNHSAEERLLSTIVGDAPETEPASHKMTGLADELNAIRSELEAALETRQKAFASRDRSRQDLQILKTRFAALESDLASARAETEQANQLKLQAETRYTNAEQLWSDKLSQLRRMLDDVEIMRDELNNKRVPKILFIGTLVVGALATVFAFFIGYNVGQPLETASLDTTPALTATASSKAHIPPPPAISPLPLTPTLYPQPGTALTPTHEHLPVPITSLSHSEVAPSPTWPELSGTRWTSTRIGQEVSLVFNYGLFSEGTELTATAKQDLKAFASAIKGAHLKLEIEGHTDSTAAGKSKTSGTNNKALGLSRAKKVAAYLTQQCGLSPEKITTSSAGEFRPPHPNTTAGSRKMNRTVVLKIGEM